MLEKEKLEKLLKQIGLELVKINYNQMYICRILNKDLVKQYFIMNWEHFNDEYSNFKSLYNDLSLERSSEIQLHPRSVSQEKIVVYLRKLKLEKLNKKK